MCLTKACPKCGGDLYYEDHKDGNIELKCIQCGYIKGDMYLKPRTEEATDGRT